MEVEFVEFTHLCLNYSGTDYSARISSIYEVERLITSRSDQERRGKPAEVDLLINREISVLAEFYI